MKERPILFSGEMVRAILDGRKTQTRRLVLKSGVDADYDLTRFEHGRALFHANRKPKRGELLMPCFGVDCRYHGSGSLVWVKETFRLGCRDGDVNEPQVIYRADNPEVWGAPWKPSIFMPRWASRITLEVLSVRVERLNDISEEDAKAEGAPMYVAGHGEISAGELNADPGFSNFVSYRLGFESLWDSINGKTFPFKSNPFVWVISFRRLK